MTSEQDLFESPRAMIDRAREHFAELVKEEEALVSKLMGASFVEPDPETGDMLRKVRCQIPRRIRNITFDIISNLRAALDHSVFAATFAINPDADEGRIHFPVGKDEQEFLRKINDQKSQLPHNLRQFLRGFNAFDSGRSEEPINAFWLIHELSNISKHRSLLTLGTSPSMSFGIANKKAGGGFQKISDNEYIISRDPPGEINSFMVTIFRLEFSKPARVSGRPLLQVLDSVGREVAIGCRAIAGHTETGLGLADAPK